MLKSKVCLLLAFSVILSTTMGFGVRAQTTVLYVAPSLSSAEVNDTFTIDINIADVEFLYAWQANITFDPEVLSLSNIIGGEFLADQPEGSIGLNKTGENYAFIGWATRGSYIGKNGSGTLATLEFEVLTIGASPIKIEAGPLYSDQTGSWYYPTFLFQQTEIRPPPNFVYLYPPEDFTVQNGYFSNLVGPTEAIQNLIETIDTWNLHIGTENSLKARLGGAIHMLAMDKEDGAVRKLTAFVNRVEMLRARTLTGEQADHLMSEAQGIKDLLGG